MSKFVDLLTQYIDNLQVEGNYATGQIDTDEKYNDFRTALKNFGYCFTIRSSRKENHSGEGKYFIFKANKHFYQNILFNKVEPWVSNSKVILFYLLYL